MVLMDQNITTLGREDAMLDFISKDVREYMEQKGIEFTDFEKAALIFHSGLPILEIHRQLEKLADETDDDVLNKQIHERLATDRRDMETFKNNTQGYVYVVWSCEDEKERLMSGCYANADLAHAHGTKLGCPFDIEKHRICGTEVKMKEGFACFSYDKDGVLQWFWGDDLHIIQSSYHGIFNHIPCFENAYVNTPNPFELGDIVRVTADNRHGVVSTSRREWNLLMHTINHNGMYHDRKVQQDTDFSDAGITVDVLVESGDIVHYHINPVFLEKYEPSEEDEDYDVLTAASGVYTGRCSLDWFTDSYDTYKKSRLKNFMEERGITVHENC